MNIVKVDAVLNETTIAIVPSVCYSYYYIGSSIQFLTLCCCTFSVHMWLFYSELWNLVCVKMLKLCTTLECLLDCGFQMHC